MKNIYIAIGIAAVLVLGAFVYNQNSITTSQASVDNNNVSIVDGKQIVVIHAKGGFQPRKSVAKAGVPTILRFDTNGTFDCSSSVRIPSMNISKLLPQSGQTDIDLGTQPASVLKGTCGMGMYPFEIDFQS